MKLTWTEVAVAPGCSPCVICTARSLVGGNWKRRKAFLFMDAVRFTEQDDAPSLLSAQLPPRNVTDLPELPLPTFRNKFRFADPGATNIDRLLRHGALVIKMGNATQLHLRGACEPSDVHKYESHTRTNQDQRHDDQRGPSSGQFKSVECGTRRVADFRRQAEEDIP
jgi:hypothetical protein